VAALLQRLNLGVLATRAFLAPDGGRSPRIYEVKPLQPLDVGISGHTGERLYFRPYDRPSNSSSFGRAAKSI
jgi:hypothetical protein